MHVYRRVQSKRCLIVATWAVKYVDTHDQSAFVVFSSAQSKSPYLKLCENEAKTTEILLAKDRSVESSFEKKSCPIENTRKM